LLIRIDKEDLFDDRPIESPLITVTRCRAAQPSVAARSLRDKS
jgi:hypothetical protein